MPEAYLRKKAMQALDKGEGVAKRFKMLTLLFFDCLYYYEKGYKIFFKILIFSTFAPKTGNLVYSTSYNNRDKVKSG